MANLSLCGLPFLRGFYSKDIIVDVSYSRRGSFISYMIMLVGLSLTRVYRLRLVWMRIFRFNKIGFMPVSVSEPIELVGPYFSLVFGALFSGEVLVRKLEVLCCFSVISSAEIVVTVFLFLVGFRFIISNCAHTQFNQARLTQGLLVSRFCKIYYFFLRMWYVEDLSSQPVSGGILIFSEYFTNSLDKGWLEVVGPQGVYRAVSWAMRKNEKVQSVYFITCIRGFGLGLFFLLLVLGVCVI